MESTEYNHINIRTLTNMIFDIRGVALPKGLSFTISKNISQVIVNAKDETCLVNLDNGQDFLSDFSQHVVNKKLMYDNSI